MFLITKDNKSCSGFSITRYGTYIPKIPEIFRSSEDHPKISTILHGHKNSNLPKIVGFQEHPKFPKPPQVPQGSPKIFSIQTRVIHNIPVPEYRWEDINIWKNRGSSRLFKIYRTILYPETILKMVKYPRFSRTSIIS